MEPGDLPETVSSPPIDPTATPAKSLVRDGGIRKSLAFLIVLGFFSCIAALMSFDLPDGSHDVLLVLIGALGSAFAAIVNYYYGSSSGSATKTAIAKI